MKLRAIWTADTTPLRRSSLWRGAWIETPNCIGRRGTARCRSSLWRGAWIETLAERPPSAPLTVAPLYGEGRGLKLGGLRTHRSAARVAPLYGEGRGLKLLRVAAKAVAPGVAPLYGEGRGLKPVELLQTSLTSSRSSLWRGAWIETLRSPAARRTGQVAPLYGEGRGLKRFVGRLVSAHCSSLLSMERGVD